MFMYNVLSANFNALGKSVIPLVLLIFSSVLNVFLDLFMVLKLGMGVEGVAIATVLAQGISSLLSFQILLRFLGTFHTEGKISLFNRSMLVNGTKIAIPSIIQQSIVSIGILLTQSAVNRFGSSALAGYSAGMRLESLAIVPMIATGNAVSTFTAQNLGAGQKERVRQGYRTSYLIILSFSAILLIATQLFYRPILSAFLDVESSPVAYSTGSSYLRFIGFFFCLLGFKASTDGVLRGAGDVGVYMAANLVNLSIRVAVAQLCSPLWGIEFVWYAVPLGWGTNYIISYLWYRTGHWEKKTLVSSSH